MQIHYFASVREQLGCEEETLACPASVATIADLIDVLKQRGGQWQQVLSHPNLLCALNQEICDADTAITDNDEVAFFPPVTGG